MKELLHIVVRNRAGEFHWGHPVLILSLSICPCGEEEPDHVATATRLKHCRPQRCIPVFVFDIHIGGIVEQQPYQLRTVLTSGSVERSLTMFIACICIRPISYQIGSDLKVPLRSCIEKWGSSLTIKFIDIDATRQQIPNGS